MGNKGFLRVCAAVLVLLALLLSFLTVILYTQRSDAGDYYVLTITREDTNWYKVEYTYNPTYYIKTYYCYQYVYHEDAIWDPDGGWTRYGRIMINDNWYNIEGIYAQW